MRQVIGPSRVRVVHTSPLSNKTELLGSGLGHFDRFRCHCFVIIHSLPFHASLHWWLAFHSIYFIHCIYLDISLFAFLRHHPLEARSISVVYFRYCIIVVFHLFSQLGRIKLAVTSARFQYLALLLNGEVFPRKVRPHNALE